MFFQTPGIRPLQSGKDRWQSGNELTGTRGPKMQIDESIRSFSPPAETATRKISAVFFSPLKVLALGAAAPILLCANTAWAAQPTVTAIQSAFTDQGSSSSSISATFSGPNTAGDCIVISVGWANAPGVTISSVTDSQGNTYNLGIGPTSTVNRAMYYALNIGASTAGNVVQVTFTSAGGAAHLRIAEFGGVSGVLDGEAGRQSTSATPDSGAITTTANGDLLVCAFWGGGSATPTPGTGFTALATDRWDAGMEYQALGQRVATMEPGT